MTSNIEWPHSVRCVATALAIASATPTFAQDAASPAPAAPAAESAEITPSHLAAARRAIDEIDATEQFDNILLNAATQIKSELIVNNPDKQNEISEMVDNEALALAPRRGALENEIARVYASMFTETELNEIADFYSSEAGQKLLSQGPAATREMLAAAEVWGNGIVRDLRQAAFAGMNEIYGTAGGEASTGGEAADGSDAASTPAE